MKYFKFYCRDDISDIGHAEIIIVADVIAVAMGRLEEHFIENNRQELLGTVKLVSVTPVTFDTKIIFSNLELRHKG